MYMLFGLGGQVFCYTFFYFVFEMELDQAGIPRRTRPFNTGNGSGDLDSGVTLFLLRGGSSSSFITAEFFTYRVLLPLFLVKLNDEKKTFDICTQGSLPSFSLWFPTFLSTFHPWLP